MLTFDSTGSNSPWYLIRNGAIKNYNGRKSIDKTQKENAIIVWIFTWINNGIVYEILFIVDNFYHLFYYYCITTFRVNLPKQKFLYFLHIAFINWLLREMIACAILKCHISIAGIRNHHVMYVSFVSYWKMKYFGRSIIDKAFILRSKHSAYMSLI